MDASSTTIYQSHKRRSGTSDPVLRGRVGNTTAEAVGGRGCLLALVLLAGPGLLFTGMMMFHGGARFQPWCLQCWLNIVVCVIGWVLVAIVAGIIFGENNMVIFGWVAAIGMATFFGYSQRMHAPYKELMPIRCVKHCMPNPWQGYLQTTSL